MVDPLPGVETNRSLVTWLHATWLPGYLVGWSPGYLVSWLPGQLVSGLLVNRLECELVNWSECYCLADKTVACLADWLVMWLSNKWSMGWLACLVTLQHTCESCLYSIMFLDCRWNNPSGDWRSAQSDVPRRAHSIKGNSTNTYCIKYSFR